MISIRAEENRYFVAAGGRDAALLRRIPGVRQIGATGGLQAPRQPGTILALDALFGNDGWEHSSDLAIEVVEARDREHPPAQGEATVELEGKELSVTCQYGDKELVKLVPGYRWSAAQRRWYVPAQPMALQILQRYFGPKLEVHEAVGNYLALKEIDERDAVEHAARLPDVAVVPVAADPPVPVQDPAIVAVEIGGKEASGPALLERLDRLAGAVEELVGLLKSNMDMAPNAAAAEPAPSTGETIEVDWRELLLAVHGDAAATLPRVSALLQTGSPEQMGPIRAVAGIAQGMLGDDEAALRSLRRALEDATVLDEELGKPAREAYTRSALRMLAGALQPLQEVNRPDDVLELLRNEVHRAGLGFSGDALASKDAAAVLEYLVNDPVLRTVSPTLSDCCRVAHLLSISRGGAWMVVDRVTDLLRDREIGSDGFGLAVAILANALFDASSMDEWRYRWPSDDSATAELRWLTEACLTRLPEAHADTAQLAALACLACIAGGPVEWASMEERRRLVRFVPVTSRERPYAEFLAGYQPAATGVKSVPGAFPGYIDHLREQALQSSQSHMLDVFMMQEGGGGLAHRIAEEVIPHALQRGVSDPKILLDLVDLIAESPKGDSLLNVVAGKVEDEAFAGAAAFSHEQRLILFGRALDEARKRGHDVDGVTAFDRMVRERLAHGEVAELRVKCDELAMTFKSVKVRAAVLEVLLEFQLEAGEQYEATAEELLKLARRPEAEELRLGLAGLAAAYPNAAELLRPSDGAGDEVVPSEFSVLLVGGHQWLKKHAMPVLEEKWGLKVDWIEPHSAKNGPRAVALAAGKADLVVVNVACIGHAASERVLEAIDTERTKFALQHSRGVGTLLGCVAAKLRDLRAERAAEAPAAPRTGRRGNARSTLIR